MKRRRVATGPTSQVVCHWCGHDVKEGWRSPIEGCVGGFWVVCGPLCKKRPPRTRIEMRERR